MGEIDDPRLAEAKAMPIAKVMARLEIDGLKRAGREMVGPCPRCGGRDRFGINLQKNLFQCRQCGAKGDQVHLVEFVRGMTFRAALDWLCGPVEGISDAERAERRKRAEENAARQARENEAFRRRAIAEARRIWEEGRPPEDTPVRDYLTRRGIERRLFPDFPAAIRFHPARPYMVGEGDGWRELHRGPCMLAAIQAPDNRFCGVHQTWIDLAQPKGKLKLPDPKRPGELLPAKKVHGSKKGGAIRLRPRPFDGARMVMAEGVETTLSALVADPTAAIWCGVDLGNMAGQRMLGRGRKYAGIPDLTDLEAFVPPGWVRDLVFVQDGDSEPRLTRAKLLSGCRRAMARHPGLRARIAPVPEGMDLNDVLMEAMKADPGEGQA